MKDIWKFFAVGHTNHRILNPSDDAKLDELVELLAMPENGRLLDIACGKAEFLARVAHRWKCQAIGVDLCPAFVEAARARIAESRLDPAPEIIEANGADYDAAAGSFDVAACLGASWIWRGFAGTLDALANWVRPGGLVISGEPYWRRTPPPEYLEALGMPEDTFGTHAGNVTRALDRGLGVLHCIVSSEDDWDRYEGLQWNALERYALEHPEDPDVPELLAIGRRRRDEYLRWGRDTLGWAIYVLVKDPA